MQGFDRAESCRAIMAELGLDPTANADIVSRLGDVWNSFADKSGIYPRLQYVYTAREACDRLKGGSWPLTDYEQGGAKRSLSDVFDHIAEMRTTYHDEILRLETRAQNSRPPAVGRSCRTAPVMARAWQPNPNDRAFGGDPLRRTTNPQEF